MATALPGKSVLIVEGVVGKYLRIRIGADIARVIADTLAGETYVHLGEWERNTDLRITTQSEQAGGIAGHTIVPAHTGKSQARFVDDRTRKSVNPTRPGDLRRIGIVGRERDGKNGGGEILALSLCIKTTNLVDIARGEINLHIFLVVFDEATLRADVVILDQSIRGSSIRRGVD